MEIWNGYRAGVDGAVDDYEADEAYAIDLLDEEILEKLQNKDKLFYRVGHSAEFDARVAKWIAQASGESRRGKSAPAQIVQLDRIVDEMRLHKDANEIELMQIASDISAEAHIRAMQTVRPGMMEYALEAELNYVFGKNGCVPSYNSIVGGGENACILHYVENDKELKDGDLVLIDAACEYQFYASDITRTFPVNGKFSPEQKHFITSCLMHRLLRSMQFRSATPIKNHTMWQCEFWFKVCWTWGLCRARLRKLSKPKVSASSICMVLDTG